MDPPIRVASPENAKNVWEVPKNASTEWKRIPGVPIRWKRPPNAFRSTSLRKREIPPQPSSIASNSLRKRSASR